MTDAYDTLREMLANVPDDAQVYVEELESIVEWPGITAGTFRQLIACFEGFEAMWEAREKAHDAEIAAARTVALTERIDALAQPEGTDPKEFTGLQATQPSGENVKVWVYREPEDE